MGPDDPTSRTSTPRRAWVARIVIGVVVLASLGLALASQLRDSKRIDWHFEPAWLALSLVTLAAVQPCQGELWRRLLAALGAPIATARGIAIWNVSVLGRYVPTSAMMAVIRVQLAGSTGAPRRMVAASMVYEVALLICVALALSAGFVVDLPQLHHDPLRFAAAPVALAGIMALHPKVLGPVTAWAFRRLGRDPLPRLLEMRRVLGFFLGYLATFALAGVSTYAMARALYPVGGRGLVTGVGAFAIGFAASAIAFILPAGIGAKESAMAAALTPVVPFAVGTAVAIGQRLAQTALEVGWAAVSARAARGSGDARSRRLLLFGRL